MMKPKRGRQTADDRTVIPFAPGAHRLQPPPDLDPKARQMFVEIVASCPESHFVSSDRALLATYAMALTIAARAAPLVHKARRRWRRGKRRRVCSRNFQPNCDCARAHEPIRSQWRGQAAISGRAFMICSGSAMVLEPHVKASFRKEVSTERRKERHFEVTFSKGNMTDVAAAADEALDPVDREALQRCVDLMLRDRELGELVRAKLRDEPWRSVAEFCSYSCQMDALRLKPWEHPPAWGGTPDADALVERLRACGLSRFEPDPGSALAAKEKRR
jgi:hypothetical protein